MNEKPILFGAPMVKAILEGRKTQTRRIIKTKYPLTDLANPLAKNIRVLRGGIQCDWLSGVFSIPQPCPYGIGGDRLWVKEEHFLYGKWILVFGDNDKWEHRFQCENRTEALFDPPADLLTNRSDLLGWHKRNSLFMPRWASRLTLEITDIRVERLQDITEKAAKAEGAPYICEGCGNDPRNEKQAEAHWPCDEEDDDSAGYRMGFKKLWNSINGNWKDNPWVWVISFQKVTA